MGVTGTNGKTTTAHLLLHISWRRRGNGRGSSARWARAFRSTVIAPELTTPDPFHLFPLLKDMAEAGAEYVVMEVSAHALALRKECPIVYEAAVFTNLTRDHLDFFGSMERYGAAKAMLFQKERCRLAVLNADDAFSGNARKGGGMPCFHLRAGQPRRLLCRGGGKEAALLARRVQPGRTSSSRRGCGSWGGTTCITRSRRPRRQRRRSGRTQRRRLAQGISLNAGGGRAARMGGVLYRGADIFVDFAHTPDGLEKSVAALKEECRGRLILLFGCGGNRDEGKRAEMGEVAASLADFSVITSDNPRYEDPVAIIAEIEKGYREVSNRYVAVEEREKAIEYALTHLKAGDILLVAGKGGETTQEIMGIKYRYNDKAVIKAALEKL